MPSSTLPTGTVSRQSRGARTFPPDAETSPPIEREDAGTESREQRVEPRRDRSGGSDASADAPRFGAPVAHSRTPTESTRSARLARLERENAELKREVGALRDRLRRKQEDLRDVVDRYEGLLAEARRSSGSNSTRSRPLESNSSGLLDRLSGVFERR